MNVEIREFRREDIPSMMNIWNGVVDEGTAFPQIELLTEQTAQDFFGVQTFAGVAVCDGQITGLYILHPNNVGRCGHISNASYAVKPVFRGKKIGGALVLHSMETAKAHGFRILQFNAVVAENKAALDLYAKLGFVQLGRIPGGFRLPTGEYTDIIPHYIKLI